MFWPPRLKPFFSDGGGSAQVQTTSSTVRHVELSTRDCKCSLSVAPLFPQTIEVDGLVRTDGGGAQALVTNSEGLGAPLFWGRLDRDNSGLWVPCRLRQWELSRVSGLRSEQRGKGKTQRQRQSRTGRQKGRARWLIPL